MVLNMQSHFNKVVLCSGRGITSSRPLLICQLRAMPHLMHVHCALGTLPMAHYSIVCEHICILSRL